MRGKKRKKIQRLVNERWKMFGHTFHVLCKSLIENVWLTISLNCFVSAILKHSTLSGHVQHLKRFSKISLGRQSANKIEENTFSFVCRRECSAPVLNIAFTQYHLVQRRTHSKPPVGCKPTHKNWIMKRKTWNKRKIKSNGRSEQKKLFFSSFSRGLLLNYIYTLFRRSWALTLKTLLYI